MILRCEYYISNLDDNISKYLITSINSYKRYLSFIKNSFAHPLSNGKLEGLIGKIKVIKRIAFGTKVSFGSKLEFLLLKKCFILIFKAALLFSKTALQLLYYFLTHTI
ncbi:transposase [Clostridium sp. 'deep sea']|uniref:transposase n=1 Tax=Clostridium sp. 'deep sea' TaxID=2779445 RepID=UPI0018969FC5|nr:transposase [Clostridium sp. 'deep sea']QOR35882.1 transposase [Clostridium sp. 'deep sea']